MSRIILFFITFLFSSIGLSKEVRIVAWNMKSHLIEHVVDKRAADFRDLDDNLKPDVLVITEVAGEYEAKAIADALGWSEYYASVSDIGTHYDNVYSGLEYLVVSKIPIESVVEYDASIDGKHAVFSNVEQYKAPTVLEEKVSTQGYSQIDELKNTARVTMRIDLQGGLSIFPVHLKSNGVRTCGTLFQAKRFFEENAKQPVPSDILTLYNQGFADATLQHLSNARQRESVMAAVALKAQQAINAGRVPVILGDFNTSYELGKKGNDLNEDCRLKNFSCQRAPFPASACDDGDGYDDTFAILENGYTDKKQNLKTDKWSVLTKDLGRTYVGTSFADAAIDHIAVPESVMKLFSIGEKIDKEFGSDHYPIFTIYKPNEALGN